MELIKIMPDTVEESFRLPLRTVKKNLTAITKANTKIASLREVGGIFARK